MLFPEGKKDFHLLDFIKFHFNLTVIEFSKANSPVVIRCNKCGHTYSYKRGTTLYGSKRKYFCKLCNTESVKCM